MMTKEDYMKLPKERLAELLVERDIPQMSPSPTYIPTIIQQARPLCYEPKGTCTNSFHDCVNCPRLATTGGTWTTDTQGTDIK